MQHPVIQEAAKKYNKHPLVVLIRWGIQHGTSVLAKSSNPHHIRVRPPCQMHMAGMIACIALCHHT